MLQAVLGFIIGAVLGSFSKAVADRIIVSESLGGRSYCQECKHTLAWYDLFPVFSFLLLRGRCRACHKKIPIGNLLTEIVLGFVVAYMFSIVNVSAFQLFALVVMTIVFWTDLKTGLILDKITYPASLAAFAYALVNAGINSVQFLGSAFGVSVVFALIIIVTRGRGMGWGDVKYAFFLGLVLGFPNILTGMFLAFTSGAVFSLALIAIHRKTIHQTIPFGPFLSIGAAAALLFGTQIFDWYIKML